MTATATMIAGFGLAVLGLGLWSVPLALVVGGLVLFVSGGLEHRAEQRARAAPKTTTT